MSKAGKAVIGLVLAIAAVFLIVAATRKKPPETGMEVEGEPKVLTPSQQVAAMASSLEGGEKSVLDYIEEYTKRREAIVRTGGTVPTVTEAEPGEKVVKEVVQTLAQEDEIAKVVNAACPVRRWRVRYFDKDTRQWEIVYKNAVTSTEAIAMVKPNVNGSLFSADKA